MKLQLSFVYVNLLLKIILENYLYRWVDKFLFYQLINE